MRRRLPVPAFGAAVLLAACASGNEEATYDSAMRWCMTQPGATMVGCNEEADRAEARERAANEARSEKVQGFEAFKREREATDPLATAD
jgi:hypothetical protein